MCKERSRKFSVAEIAPEKTGMGIDEPRKEVKDPEPIAQV